MEVDEFQQQIELLTGSSIKGFRDVDKALLCEVLKDDSARLDCSQFNELLLVVNKDRVYAPFFDHFFGKSCTIRTLPLGIEKFRKTAMRCYGNFVFAYRTLSRLGTVAELASELGDVGRDQAELLADFKGRSAPLLRIDKIARDDTYLLGYLSAKTIAVDVERYAALIREIRDDWHDWPDVTVPSKVIDAYKAASPAATLDEFRKFLKESEPEILKLDQRIDKVRDRAKRNQDVYLTWDHMDVYFATSMRKSWEYEELYDYIAELLRSWSVKRSQYPLFRPDSEFRK